MEGVLGHNHKRDDIHHSFKRKKKRVQAKQRVFLLPTVAFFPSLSFHDPPFPLFSYSLPFSIALALSFHTSLPLTPSSPSADFGLPPLPLPPRPANLFQKKGYHGERITSAHTSARAKREITQRRKNGSGVGYRQAEKGEKVFIQTQS